MAFISSFEIVKVVVRELCIFFWIPACIVEAAVVVPNEAKICFAKGTKVAKVSLLYLLIYLIMILKVHQTEFTYCY